MGFVPVWRALVYVFSIQNIDEAKNIRVTHASFTA